MMSVEKGAREFCIPPPKTLPRSSSSGTPGGSGTGLGMDLGEQDRAKGRCHLLRYRASSPCMAAAAGGGRKLGEARGVISGALPTPQGDDSPEACKGGARRCGYHGEPRLLPQLRLPRRRCAWTSPELARLGPPHHACAHAAAPPTPQEAQTQCAQLGLI